MRKDTYIENDSGALSILSGAAAEDIVRDARGHDLRFVENHQAMLLELDGDDSMPVRVVVDEPLTPDEENQWLARATWQLNIRDGRMLVMGGFDPDVLQDVARGPRPGRGQLGCFSRDGAQRDVARARLHACGLQRRPAHVGRARGATRHVLPADTSGCTVSIVDGAVHGPLR